MPRDDEEEEEEEDKEEVEDAGAEEEAGEREEEEEDDGDEKEDMEAESARGISERKAKHTDGGKVEIQKQKEKTMHHQDVLVWQQSPLQRDRCVSSLLAFHFPIPFPIQIENFEK